MDFQLLTGHESCRNFTIHGLWPNYCQDKPGKREDWPQVSVFIVHSIHRFKRANIRGVAQGGSRSFGVQYCSREDLDLQKLSPLLPTMQQEWPSFMDPDETFWKVCPHEKLLEAELLNSMLYQNRFRTVNNELQYLGVLLLAERIPAPRDLN